jgi:hypothetical protein
VVLGARPRRRRRPRHHPQPDPAFLFAEMQQTDYTPAGWMPKFADYLSLSFWTATAFSATDVSAIKRWAKMLMIPKRQCPWSSASS